MTKNVIFIEDTDVTKQANWKKGHSPLVSNETMGQLHTFIFILAGVHVIYSLLAMLLASIKVNGWKVWEEEAHQDTQGNLWEVVKSMSLHQVPDVETLDEESVLWLADFLRQFAKSVVRADYLALRLGFIRTHNMSRTYDFRSYIVRSLEDEYQELVLLVGAKLQQVIATLALESAGFTQNGAYAGSIVGPRDEIFWFRRPQLILCLIHYIFFQNAFEMARFTSFAVRTLLIEENK
ncbi:unnamed protein product [Calypogeia fissa]